MEDLPHVAKPDLVAVDRRTSRRDLESDPTMKALPFKLWLLLCTLLIVLVGCGPRGPADIEADAEKHFAKLAPLAKEVKAVKGTALADKKAYDAKHEATIEALTHVETKLAALLGTTPAPSPTPGPSPVVPPPGPAPAPAPDPTPPKPTVLPSGEFNISNDVKTWAETLVPPEGRATGIAHFLRAAKAIAKDCDDGKITGSNRITLVLAIKEAIGVQNATIPADVLVHWKAFATAFNKRANELFNAGRLTEPKHWKQLLTEVVIGLEAVK